MSTRNGGTKINGHVDSLDERTSCLALVPYSFPKKEEPLGDRWRRSLGRFSIFLKPSLTSERLSTAYLHMVWSESTAQNSAFVGTLPQCDIKWYMNIFGRHFLLWKCEKLGYLKFYSKFNLFSSTWGVEDIWGCPACSGGMVRVVQSYSSTE